MDQKTLQNTLSRLRFNKKNRKQLFLQFSEEEKAYLLLQLSRRVQRGLASVLTDSELIPTLEQLDPDEATDIIQLLPKHRQPKLISCLNKQLKREVEILNQFDPQTAAGLMNLDYIQVEAASRIEEVAKRFQTHEKRTGKPPVVIVTNKGKITGFLPGHALGLTKPTDKVSAYTHHIPTIYHNAPHEKVIEVFRRHPHGKLAVIGEEGGIVGIIYSDDILRLLQGKQSSSLYDFAGVHDEESVVDSGAEKIRHRYKWLIVNLGTAFLAAFSVRLFDQTIAKYVLLAVYMPIVAGMGGNAGTQTLAVMVRGISLNQIELKNVWPILKGELTAGFFNGLINGLIVASVVTLFNHNFRIAFVLGTAMVINLLVSAFFGTMVPLVLRRLGKDPATSATVFITTATDVLGFLAFLGLATILLP